MNALKECGTKNMKRLDNKHHLEGEQIVKTGNGQPIPDDEPVILFRARDNLALPMLRHYLLLCKADGCTDFQLESMTDMILRFREFSERSPTMKQPGCTRGL
jgi:hypothetical protein